MTTVFSRVGALIAFAAIAAGLGLAATLPSAVDAFSAHPLEFSALLILTLLLQTCSLRVSTRGSISVSSIGVLATAFALGAGAAMLVAITAAVVQWIRRRGLLHRAIFDAANFSLSAGIAATVFGSLAGADTVQPSEIVAATLAGAAYCVFNTGLLCIAMGLAEGTSARAIWRQRFRWATPHYLAAGPLAFASLLAYESVGVPAFLLFAVPYAVALVAHRRFAVAA